MRKWLGLQYNFASGSFHTKKLCNRLYSIEIEYYFFKSLFEPCTFIGELGVTSIARWKVRGRLPIRHNWTFFAISYGWDVISGNLSKFVFFEGVGHIERKFQTEWLPFRAVSKYPQCIVWLCHKARVWQADGQTDRRADGQNYDSQDRANVAVSRGKNQRLNRI